MIDTIILRVHGYEKYKHIVKQLLLTENDEYTVKYMHEGLENHTKTNILFGDTGRVLPVHMRTSIYCPSSHYSISVLPNEGRDFIELNFSLPKYEYSTNVLQFIDSHNQTIEHCFDKMRSLIYNLFNKYFAYPPEWKDVEVNRIDMCFNQIFLSKADALRYMEEQRTLNLDYARSDKNRFQSYGSTTLQYHTDNYSFKIYHKGTEFRKNDLNKLLKNNPLNLDLNLLTDVADKTLRYEMSCKKGALNYVFRQSVKDDINTIFNHHYGIIANTRTRKRNNLVKVAKNNFNLYGGQSKNVLEWLEKTLPNKSFGFHLDSSWESLHTETFDLLEDYRLCFNIELFRALHIFFWKRVQAYQLGVKMGIKEIFDKIQQKKDEKNFKNTIYGQKEKQSYVGQLLLLASLSQYTDISDLKGIIPKATYYRYKKSLEEMGIPKHSPDICVNPPPLDYQMYLFYFSKYHTKYN